MRVDPYREAFAPAHGEPMPTRRGLGFDRASSQDAVLGSRVPLAINSVSGLGVLPRRNEPMQIDRGAP
jgi:hypothetical protein